MEKTDESESREKLAKELRALLAEQLRLLDVAISDLAEISDAEDLDKARKARVLTLMIQGLGSSINSVLRLTEEVSMMIRDCYGIARQISETAINIGYIAASDVAIAERAEKHALQKWYRDLSREYSKGGISISTKRGHIPPADEIEGLSEALTLFTNTKGNEIREWIGHSLDYRIRIVDTVSKRGAIALAGSSISITRNSSELLHGTYAGVVYFWTGQDGKLDGKEGFERRWTTQHLQSIFTACFFAAGGVLDVLDSCFGIRAPVLGQRMLEKHVSKIMNSASAAI